MLAAVCTVIAVDRGGQKESCVGDNLMPVVGASAPICAAIFASLSDTTTTTTMFKTVANRVAHNTTIPGLGGNKDLRPLQDLITSEKTLIIA